LLEFDEFAPDIRACYLQEKRKLRTERQTFSQTIQDRAALKRPLPQSCR